MEQIRPDIRLQLEQYAREGLDYYSAVQKLKLLGFSDEEIKLVADNFDYQSAMQHIDAETNKLSSSGDTVNLFKDVPLPNDNEATASNYQSVGEAILTQKRKDHRGLVYAGLIPAGLAGGAKLHSLYWQQKIWSLDTQSSSFDELYHHYRQMQSNSNYFLISSVAGVIILLLLAKSYYFYQDKQIDT